MVVLTCISVTISDTEPLVLYLSASICLLWRNIHLDLLPFFNHVVWDIYIYIYIYIYVCMNYLCILEINPLLVALFANIFSHSVTE